MNRLVALLLSLAPTAAQACPICFSRNNDNAGLIKGLTIGLAVLLVPTMAAIASLVVTAVRIEKEKMARDTAEGLYP